MYIYISTRRNMQYLQKLPCPDLPETSSTRPTRRTTRSRNVTMDETVEEEDITQQQQTVTISL